MHILQEISVPKILLLAFLLLWSSAGALKINGGTVVKPPTEKPKADYVVYTQDGYYNRSRTPSSQFAPSGGNVVELLIVCDKEWGDIFNHDMQKIRDYWTTYMWDVNLRYRTLPSVRISFVVTGIVVMASKSDQPFIEEARAPDGRVEHGRVLDRFTSWIYEKAQSSSVPKHDMAIIVSNAEHEWGGGLAWMNGACRIDHTNRRSINTVSFNDGGNWGSLTVGAHEMGHNLGAPHDDDQNFAGGCSERGYIMGGGNDDFRWFFSSCSDRLVSSYVGSSDADCLRRTDGTPALDPEFQNPKAPSTTELCKIMVNDDEAFMEPGDEKNCKSMRCVYPREEGGWWIQNLAPVDNAICGASQRCFRGRCRTEGSLLKNVGSNLCLLATNPFANTAAFEVTDCPAAGTPLDRFVIASGSTGTTLATPFSVNQGNNNQINEDKCAYVGVGSNEAAGVWTDACGDYTNPWHGWDLVDTGNSQFLVKHKITGRCIKPEGRQSGNAVLAYNTCDSNNQDMKWTRV